MARLLFLPDVLRDAGLKVTTYPGWERRGSSTMEARPSLLMQHHTAGVGGGILDLLANGRSDLAGPLCHVCPRPTGEMVIIASGKANHAGKGQWKPADGPTITSSTQCIGFENEHQGVAGYPWPPAQLEAIEIGTAAILRHLGRSHERSVLHKEWATPPGRKPDPYAWNGPKHRERLRLRMIDDAYKEEEVTEDDINKIAAAVAVAMTPAFELRDSTWWGPTLVAAQDAAADPATQAARSEAKVQELREAPVSETP